MGGVTRTVKACSVENRETQALCLWDDIFRFNAQLGVTDWPTRFECWLIDLPVQWTKIFLSPSLEKSYMAQWIDNHGQWQHSGSSHNDTGMIFAGWVEAENRFDDFILSDSPDFSGTLDGHRVFGDIGRCSPMAALDSFKQMHIHDLWISVLSVNCQIILEFAYDIGKLLSRTMEVQLFGEYWESDPEQVVKDIFYCPRCAKWTITNESRTEQIKYWEQMLERNPPTTGMKSFTAEFKSLRASSFLPPKVEQLEMNFA